VALMELANLTLRSPEGDGAVARILAQMPDPMRPDLPALLFVIVLLIVLYVFLRAVFFQPITQLMDAREKDLNAGGDAKAQATALLEARQKDYQARLKDLRAKAFDKRKTLADAAAKEKQHLVDGARASAQAERMAALESLKAQQVEARQSLLSQVDALAEAMAQSLLKQA
jgi:F0F1-type ATP synthase membrane subunit b/b'